MNERKPKKEKKKRKANTVNTYLVQKEKQTAILSDHDDNTIALDTIKH